jgi:hypothetical protein
MDSAQLKRMILDKSESTGIRRKLLEQKDTGITQDDVVEMGVAFEQMVSMKGWAFIEAYLLRKWRL